MAITEFSSPVNLSAEDLKAFLETHVEKGAWRFYAAIAERHDTEPFAETFEVLAKAENTHAQTIYAIWASHTAEPPAFEDLFAGLSGDILEGGETLETVLDGR